MRAYLHDNRIGSVEPMVELYARTFRLDVCAQQPYHVTHFVLMGFHMPISILLLSCDDLFPVLLNDVAEFHQLLCPCLVSGNSLNDYLYNRVVAILSKKWRKTDRDMDATIIGIFG
jgi:hypothetical protein